MSSKEQKAKMLRMRGFRLAQMVAKNSTMRARVGAVITRGSKVLSTACNVPKTTPLLGKHASHHPWSSHAEMRAIAQAGIGDVQGAIAWIYRETSDGSPAMARPCEEFCMEMLRMAGIRRICYTTNEPPYFAEENL